MKKEEIDKALYKLRLMALHKAAIILDALGDKMDYQAKEECEVLVDSVHWAEKELRKSYK